MNRTPYAKVTATPSGYTGEWIIRDRDNGRTLGSVRKVGDAFQAYTPSRAWKPIEATGAPRQTLEGVRRLIARDHAYQR